MRVFCLFHNKVYLYHLHTLGSSDLCQVPTSIPQQGLFVPFAHVGSGDHVRVLRLFHNKVYLYHLTTFALDIVEVFIAIDYVQLVTTKAKC